MWNPTSTGPVGRVELDATELAFSSSNPTKSAAYRTSNRERYVKSAV